MAAEPSISTRARIFIALTLLSLSLSACGLGQNGEPNLLGLQRFRAGVIEQRLFVSFVASELHWDQGATIPIPGLPTNGDATISFSPDLQSPGTVFQFAMALSLLSEFAKPYPLSGLPDGRPLPDINGGQLPRWDFALKDRNLSIYLSKDVFGFFFPLNLKLPSGLPILGQLRIPLLDERGNRWGYSYAMGEPTTGVLILLPLSLNSSTQTLGLTPLN